MAHSLVKAAVILSRASLGSGDARGAGEICAAVARLLSARDADAELRKVLRAALDDYERATDAEARAAALLADFEKSAGDVVAPTAGPPLDVMKAHITTAILIGAAAYNARDHLGCFQIYSAVARMLLATVTGADTARARLQAALAECERLDDADGRAWAMRRGFDEVLRRATAPAEPRGAVAPPDAARPAVTVAAHVVHYPDGDLYPNTSPPIWKPKDGPPVAISASVPPAARARKLPSQRRKPS